MFHTYKNLKLIEEYYTKFKKKRFVLVFPQIMCLLLLSLSFFSCLPTSLFHYVLCSYNWNYTESLVRYRLLSEPEISNLLKTTISNHSIQSSHQQQQQQSSHNEESSSDLDMPKNNMKDQHNSVCTNNDKKSQNRNNNTIQA